METNKVSNLNRIFTRNMLRHLIDGKTDNVKLTYDDYQKLEVF